MKRPLGVLFFGALAGACASAQKSAAPPPASAAGAPAKDEPAASASPSDVAAMPGAAPPPQQVEAMPSGGAPTGSRAVAISQASREIDAAQRELDVAAGDCRNACRALGSMDRAAGRVCVLEREDGSNVRCAGAKQRLYAARDRVRSTCGTCPDGRPAVERDAPVPSMP